MRNDPAPFEPDGRILSRIGICVAAGGDDLGRALFSRIVRGEIQRRLPAAAIRSFGLEPYAQPQGLDGGEPLESLGSWIAERAEGSGEQLDCMIVGGGDLVSGPLIETLARELETKCPLIWLGVGLPVDPTPEEAALLRSIFDGSPYASVKDEVSKRRLEAAGVAREIEVAPDPAVLAARHFDREVLEKRLEYLRLMGWYPARGGPLVVQGDGGAARFATALAGPIARILKARGDPSVVVADISSSEGGEEFAGALIESLPESSYRIPSEVEVEDWIAAIASASGFIGTSSHGAMVAMTYGKPAVILDLDGRFDPSGLGVMGVGAPIVGEAKEVGESFEQAETAATEMMLDPLGEQLDRHLNHLAEIAREAGIRGGRVEQEELLAFESEAALLRTAHEVLSRRLVAERSLFADLASSWPEVARLEAEVARLDRDLRSLMSRRLYRYSVPLLSLYGRLRRWLRIQR
jgi:polysaccharide pyruvyl transferase